MKTASRAKQIVAGTTTALFLISWAPGVFAETAPQPMTAPAGSTTPTTTVASPAPAPSPSSVSVSPPPDWVKMDSALSPATDPLPPPKSLQMKDGRTFYYDDTTKTGYTIDAAGKKVDYKNVILQKFGTDFCQGGSCSPVDRLPVVAYPNVIGVGTDSIVPMKSGTKTFNQVDYNIIGDPVVALLPPVTVDPMPVSNTLPAAQPVSYPMKDGRTFYYDDASKTGYAVDQKGSKVYYKNVIVQKFGTDYCKDGICTPVDRLPVVYYPNTIGTASVSVLPALSGTKTYNQVDFNIIGDPVSSIPPPSTGYPTPVASSFYGSYASPSPAK